MKVKGFGDISVTSARSWRVGGMCTTSPRRTRVRTPHLPALIDALAARDHGFEVLGPDAVVVESVAPDDLGWLAAGAGVVIYEMTPVDDG